VDRIVITGGAGFIGSHVVEHFCDAFPDARIVVLDKMTYAADFRNVSSLVSAGRIELVVGDICDFELCARVVHKADLVLHTAAESHVDNSFGNSLRFTTTNTLGTHTLMEACRLAQVPRIVHISTDEVYGEVLDGSRSEDDPLNPTNPYSASKAAAEMIIAGYRRSFALPVIQVRANNIYGTRQYPEKLIPKSLVLLLHGRKISLHGDGRYRRHYLSVHDFAAGLATLARKGQTGLTYNIGSEEEFANIDVAAKLCELLGKDLETAAEFTSDRPFNDQRYSISSDRIRALGWETKRRLVDELPALVTWYRDNLHRYGRLFPDETAG
jgi:dTDP-glucose 4,6-dehydratase